VLTAPELARVTAIHTQAGMLESCLTLTQCDRELTVIIGSDIIADFQGVQLVGNQVVRLVAGRWYSDEVGRLRLETSGDAYGWRDADGERWVPNHSRRRFEVVPIAESERLRLLSHLERDQHFEFFKYVQLVYLGCDGFAGGQHLLKSPADYARIRLPECVYF
jgi:hypothetical protein